MQKFPVIFRKQTDGEILAVFPNQLEYNLYLECYAHIGQHSTCSLDYYRSDTRPATPEEYADLLAELTAIYTTRPAANPEVYGEPVELVIRKRISRR